jgi:hypothetical protein
MSAKSRREIQRLVLHCCATSRDITIFDACKVLTPSLEIMKLSMRIAIFFISAVAVMQLASCLNEDNKIPPNCYDGILNNGEERIDCGGVNCIPCDPCENGQWDPELGEQWVDCGGDCDPCDVHFNGQLDPGETGIDCGGTTGVACGELCGDGLLNGFETEPDCGGPNCDPCPTCDDEMMNQDEIGIDCGGVVCEPCATNGDCTNGIIDGDELYIDCGGSTCPDCVSSMSWKVGAQTIFADFQASAQMAGNDILMNGVSILPAVMTVVLPEPQITSWQNNSTITLNAATFPVGQVTYTNAQGVTFSTEYGVSTATFNIAFVLPGAGGVVAGTFTANLRNEDESQVVSITQGNFVMLID